MAQLRDDLTAAELQKVKEFQDCILLMEQQITEFANALPAGREFSLAKTKFDEAFFWLNAGVKAL